MRLQTIIDVIRSAERVDAVFYDGAPEDKGRAKARLHIAVSAMMAELNAAGITVGIEEKEAA